MRVRPSPVTTVALLALVLASGCLGATSTTDGPPADVATTSGGSTSEPARCTGDETPPRFDLPWGALPSRAGGFALTASADSVERGDPIAFRLGNVGDETLGTSTPKRYALQRLDSGVWQTATTFRSGRSGFNATAVSHAPGTGFTWSFRASAAGFSDKFVVCDRLTPGEYRFVYAGTAPALAVRFEVRE